MEASRPAFHLPRRANSRQHAVDRTELGPPLRWDLLLGPEILLTNLGNYVFSSTRSAADSRVSLALERLSSRFGKEIGGCTTS